MKKILILLVVCALSAGTMYGLAYLPDIPNRELVYAGISAFYLAAGCVALRLTTRKTTVVKFFSLRPLRLSDSFIFIWSLLAIISGSYLLSFLEIKFWSIFNISMTVGSFQGMSTENVWLMFLSVGLIPAVFEELFFRGAANSALEFRNRAPVYLISSVFFFLLHGSPFGSLSIIYAGLMFSLLTSVTGSIVSAMLAHLINNVLTYMLNVYAERLSVVGLEYMIVYALVFILLLSAYGTLSCVYSKFKKETAARVTIYNEGELVWENQKKSKRKQNG